ncbi:unnamed protein product [Symbiodinium sp. CCMP2592]|nr:unnamed protein product [Symbiodinium sp. CCMP2592]
MPRGTTLLLRQCWLLHQQTLPFGGKIHPSDVPTFARILQESWKRSGARNDVSSYRPLFVSSLPGKSARKRAPVLLPALYLQAFLRGEKKVGRSVAIVFLDSQSAYYRVIRELAVGEIELESDRAVSYIFKVFGLQAEDMEAFRAMIREGGMMGDANMRPPLRHLVKDMLYRSWFATRHGTQERVNVTRAGSRPGSRWADVVYAFVLSRILTQLHEVATAEELLTPLQVNEEWADDCAFQLSDGSPTRLMRKLGRLTALIIEFSERHGMIPNLKPKKTATIVALRGIQIAPAYVHPGGVIEPEMKLVQVPDLTIPLPLRASLFHTAVTSTGFNLGLWVPNGRAWDLLAGGFTKILKGLLYKQFKGELYYKLPAPVVHILTETPALATYARKARLSLLMAMCWTAPALLWAVLQRDDVWNATVRKDLAFVREGGSQWPDLHPASWPRWHHLLKELGNLGQAPQIAAKIAKEFVYFGREQLTLLALWGLYKRACSQWPKASEVAAPWVCRICCKAVRTKAALGARALPTARSPEERPVGPADATTGLGQDLRFTYGTRLDALLYNRGWRAAAEMDFTMAVPEQQTEAAATTGEARWPDEVMRAYNAVCDELTRRFADETAVAFQTSVLDVLVKFPLYFVEVREVLDEIEADVRMVCTSGVNDYWSTEGTEHLLEALHTLSADVWVRGVDLDEPDRNSCSEQHGTRDDTSVTLGDDWEAAWDRPSEVVGYAAVQSDFWCLLPGPLQRAWDLILEGDKPIVQAPNTRFQDPTECVGPYCNLIRLRIYL